MEIKKYTKSELEEISKVLKKYRTLRRNVGKKSTNLIHHELSGENKILIEYFPALDKKEFLDKATEIYSETFGIKVNIDKITWKENTTLAGGMRLFFGDDMLDVSFESVRNILKKV